MIKKKFKGPVPILCVNCQWGNKLLSIKRLSIFFSLIFFCFLDKIQKRKKRRRKKDDTYIKLTAATTGLRWCCQKINLFTKKWTKSVLNEKSMFLDFSHFNNFFGTHGHIQAIFFLDLMLSALSQSQSPQHSKTFLQSLDTKPETHFIFRQSRENLLSLQFKRPKVCNF